MGTRKRRQESVALVEVMEDKVGLDLVLPRIGRSTRERIEWVVTLVQRDPQAMTPGDRENLRLELAAFAYLGNPLPESQVHRLKKLEEYIGPIPTPKLEPVPEADLSAVLDRLRRNIEHVVRREGHYPTDASERLWRVWDPWRQEWVAWTLRKLSWPDLAALALDRLVGEFGDLVKGCPAPGIRARTGEQCGRWFVAKRPNQGYCSGTCQSRASTRAARAGTETPATLQRQDLGPPPIKESARSGRGPRRTREASKVKAADRKRAARKRGAVKKRRLALR